MQCFPSLHACWCARGCADLSAAKDPVMKGSQRLVHSKFHCHVRDILQQRGQKPLHATTPSHAHWTLHEIKAQSCRHKANEVRRHEAAWKRPRDQTLDRGAPDVCSGPYREEAANASRANKGLRGCDGIGMQPSLNAADAHRQWNLHHTATHRGSRSSRKCHRACRTPPVKQQRFGR